jgi:hypothetical protein
VFTFESVPAASSLMRAIELLREMNGSGKPVSKSAPIGFIKPRWAAQVMPDGAIDHRYYELCVLSELRDRLRAGDVWVNGSRQYRSFDERLISKEAMETLQKEANLPVAVEVDFKKFIEARRVKLHNRLMAVDARAAEGKLPDVTLIKGVLKMPRGLVVTQANSMLIMVRSPGSKSTPICRTATRRSSPRWSRPQPARRCTSWTPYSTTKAKSRLGNTTRMVAAIPITCLPSARWAACNSRLASRT